MSKKYYYLSVRYDDEPEGFGYRYISDDTSIKKGDRVLVERQDHLATGHVLDTSFFNYNEVPYPVEYTKKIIQKIDEKYVLPDGEKTEIPGGFYDNLSNSIVDGELKDFDVNDYKYNKKENIRWADGIEENIFNIKEDKKAIELLEKKLQELNINNITKTTKEIENYFVKHKVMAFGVVDNILDFIRENFEDYDNFYRLGISLIIYPKNIEVVKIGIVLLSLFMYEDESEVYTLFNDLSYVDGLGKYLAFLYSHQNNKNKLLINAAKKVDGWGRINYIQQMDLSDEKTLKWVLEEGYENWIGIFEIADYIANNTNLSQCLDKYINEPKIINGLLEIVEGLDDGPNYIGDYEQRYEFLRTLIKNYENLKENIRFYSLLNTYLYYFDNKEEPETEEETSLVVEIEKIKRNPDTTNCLKKIVNKGTINEVSDVCRFLMNYEGEHPHKEIFNFYKKQKSCIGIIYSYLMYQDEYRDETHRIALKNIDETDYDLNPKPLVSIGAKYFNLDYIVTDLENYPFYDNNIVILSIKCEDLNVRNRGLETLISWMKAEKTKFENLPEDIKETMKFIKEKEMMKKNIKLINKIMNIKEDLKGYKDPEIINDTEENFKNVREH